MDKSIPFHIDNGLQPNPLMENQPGAEEGVRYPGDGGLMLEEWPWSSGLFLFFIFPLRLFDEQFATITGFVGVF